MKNHSPMGVREYPISLVNSSLWTEETPHYSGRILFLMNGYHQLVNGDEDGVIG